MIIIRNVEPEVEDFENPELVFEKMANFVTNIDTGLLNDGQKEMLSEILNEFDDINEALAIKSTEHKKRYAKEYYRGNKAKIKNQRKSLKTSIEGDTRKKMAGIMSKQDKSPTGKKRWEKNA